MTWSDSSLLPATDKAESDWSLHSLVLGKTIAVFILLRTISFHQKMLSLYVQFFVFMCMQSMHCLNALADITTFTEVQSFNSYCDSPRNVGIDPRVMKIVCNFRNSVSPSFWQPVVTRLISTIKSFSFSFMFSIED